MNFCLGMRWCKCPGRYRCQPPLPWRFTSPARMALAPQTHRRLGNVAFAGCHGTSYTSAVVLRLYIGELFSEVPDLQGCKEYLSKACDPTMFSAFWYILEFRLKFFLCLAGLMISLAICTDNCTRISSAAPAKSLFSSSSF